MMTLLKSATNGWLDYTQHGKYAALLLAAILYLGYCLWKSKAARNGGKQPLFYLYAVLITLACICPVTAVILMKYQTATKRAQFENLGELVKNTIFVA